MKKLFLPMLLIALSLSGCRQKGFDEKCAAEIREYTLKQCPQAVAEGLVIDSAAYRISPRRVVYYYSLSGKIDSSDIVLEKGNLIKAEFLKQLRNSLQYKAYKEAGVTFVYVFVSAKRGRKVAEWRFSPADYK